MFCTYFHLCLFNALDCVSFFLFMIVYLFNKQNGNNNECIFVSRFQIKMLGFTNELPAFCFDRDELSMVKENEQIFDAMDVLF